MTELKEIEDKLKALLRPIYYTHAMEYRESEDSIIEIERDALIEKLSTIRHSDDDYHNGETILEHIRNVYDALEDEKLKLVALFHDLGKVYAHREIEGRQTFRGHEHISYRITENVLANTFNLPLEWTQDIRKLVLCHDDLHTLVYKRSQRGSSPYKYLRRFEREPIGRWPLFDDLVKFTFADIFKSKTFATNVVAISNVMSDLKEYRLELEQKAVDKAYDEYLKIYNAQQYANAIYYCAARVLGEDQISWERPVDISALFRQLGATQRKEGYEAIKEIQNVLARDNLADRKPQEKTNVMKCEDNCFFEKADDDGKDCRVCYQIEADEICQNGLHVCHSCAEQIIRDPKQCPVNQGE